jgi:large subunit ribosomal protein L18
LASANSLKITGSLTKKATEVGQMIAAAAKEKKISSAVFDRGGFAYAGSVKALCEAARSGGLTI